MRSKCLSIFLLVMLAGCSKESETVWEKSAVAPVKLGTPVLIRVVHANNPRFARWSPDYLKILLASAQLTAWKDLGIYIEFTDISETGVEQIFSLIPPNVIKERTDSIYDFKSATGDKHKLAEGIDTTLTQRGTKLEDGLQFAKSYIPDVHPKDIKSFSELLANVMLERLENWRHVNAADGKSVFDATPYNEWVYWDTLGYGNLPYDLVITNQLIASAEYYGVDIHSAIRGGVSVGTTSYSRTGKYGSYIVWSTFPFMDNSENTKRLRGGEQYTDEFAAELSGAYLAHEIGHLLFQLGHPFGQKSCVMNPVSMLRFKEWFEQINGADCPLGSRAEMTAGAIPPYFNPDWVKMAQQK